MDWLNRLFVPEETINLAEEAEYLIQSGDYDKSLLKINMAIVIKPNYPDYYVIQALCYYLKEMYSSAVYSLKEAFKLDINHKEAWYYLGLIKKDLRQYEEAIESFRKAIQNGYQKPDIYNNLANIYFKLNQIEKAIAQYNLAIAKNNLNIESYKKLAFTYIEVNNPEEAINVCRAALAINTKDWEIYSLLGEAYSVKGDYQNSTESFIKALELNSKNPYIVRNIIDISYRLKKYSEASEYIRVYLGLFDYKDYEIIKELADCYLKIGKINQAIIYYQELIEVIGESAIINSSLGKCYLSNSELKDADKAIEYLKKAEKSEAENPETFYHLGLAYLESNCFDISLQYFQKVLINIDNSEIKPFEIYKNIGINYLKLNQAEQSEEYFQKSIKLTSEKDDIFELNYWLDQAHELNNKEMDTSASNKLYNLILKLEKRMAKESLFADLKNKITEIIADFDKPLTVTVMGEFKVGKSTFINALIGKDIAPMGVTPTTATINFFQYGSRNRIRINWIDEVEPDIVRIDKLSEYVDERKADKAELEKISLVEIFYDWEELRNINVVDTPGLNAGIKRHEETTIKFIEKADALIWLFDVEQAGKQSEKKIFDYIKQFSKKSVGVINGLDKIDHDDFIEVKDYLKEQFGNYFSDFIGVSAKLALKGKINNDENSIENSNFKELETFLNTQIYTKSTEIKNNNILNKVNAIIIQIKEIIKKQKNIYNENLALINQLEEEISNLKVNSNLLSSELFNSVKNDFTLLYEKVSKEVKEFVNPAKGLIETVFGNNKYNREERVFIEKLIREEVNIILNNQKNNIENKLKNSIEKILNLLQRMPEYKYYDYFLNYHEIKIKDLYRVVILPEYRYYLGFIESGVLDKYFSEISYNNDLSLNKLMNIIGNYLPDISNLLKNNLSEWLNEYILFLQQLHKKIGKEINDNYLEHYNSALRPLEKLFNNFTDLENT